MASDRPSGLSQRPSARLVPVRSAGQALTVGAMVLIIALGMTVCALMAASVALDLASDREHPHANSTYRVTTRTPSLFTTVIRADERRAETPKELKAALLQGEGGILAAARVAPARSGLRAPARPDVDVRLRVMAADPEFPTLFRVTRDGRPLTSLGSVAGVWLTRPALERLEAVQGSSPAQVLVGGQPLPVLGVIDRPGPTAHLQYDAIVPFDLAADYANTVFGLVHHYPALTYVRIEGETGKARRAAARAMEQVTGLETPVDLTAVGRIRSGDAGGLIAEPRFVVSGGALERQIGLLLATISFVGVTVSLLLFVQAALEARRMEMAVRVCLGSSPRDIYVRGMGLASGLMVAAAAPAGLLILAAGDAALSLLGKPDVWGRALPAVLLCFLACSAVVLLAAGLLLAPLLLAAPVQLVRQRPAKRRLVFAATAAGMAVLVCSSGAFAFSAALFSAEVAQGMTLTDDDDRLFLAPTRPDRVETVLQAMRRRPGVAEVGILHWRPFDIPADNMSLQLDGQGPFRQATVLTGETTIVALQGQNALLGRLPRASEGPGCRAAASEALTRKLGLGRPSDMLGRTVTLAAFPEACRVVAIVADQRLDRLNAPAGPVLHVVGSSFATFTERDGSPSRQIFVRYSPTAGPDFTGLDRGTATPPSSVQQLGRNAYAREQRIAALFALSSAVMGAVFVGVCAALVLNAVEHQRRDIAIRQALGEEIGRLVLRLTSPIALGAAAGAVAAAAAGVVFIDIWRKLGGLASDTGLAPLVAVAAGALGPVLLSLAVAYICVARVQPAETLKALA